MPDQPIKTAIIPFSNKGVTTRVEPKSIPPGAFQFMFNVTSEQEGSIIPRRGRKLLGSLANGVSDPHTIAKMVIGGGEAPGTPSAPNYRYVGNQGNIFRTQDYVSYTAALNSGAVCSDPSSGLSQLWTEATYDAGEASAPWAYFACEKQMLKDQGSSPFAAGNLQQWGIRRAYSVASVAAPGGAPPGVLDGGAVGSPAGSLPYSYIYTYRNPKTGNEGNPSIFMASDSAIVDGVPYAVNLGQAAVTVSGTDDPQIDTTAGANSIALYRAGGTFADGLYRFVGFITNPGLGAQATFTDNTSDIDLATGSISEFDNDPPVTSSLKVPFTTTLQANAAAGFWTTIHVGSTTGITNGSIAHFSGQSGAMAEDVVVYVSDPTHFICAIQYSHSSGETMEIDAIAGQPCPFTVAAFDSLFLAGDPNNPHALYKSKTGLPESFPVIDALGNAGSINVGTWSNPIQSICEFRGNLICLNLQNLFEVQVFGGVMYAPNVTPAQRGLLTPKAWCIADNEIWYLAYDGIWSWNGGEAVKRSEPIDGVFHGFTITAPDGNSIPPIDLTATTVQWARMEYYRKQIHFWYRSVNAGDVTQLVYDLTFNRWEVGYNAVSLDETTPRTLFLERDLGNLIYARHNTAGGVGAKISVADVLDASQFTDDEFTSGAGALASGAVIDWKCMTGWMDLGNEYMPKVFNEMFLDVDPQGNTGVSAVSIIVNVYYDYYNLASDTFSIPASSLGRQWVSLTAALQTDTVLSTLATFGRQASVVAFEFLGNTASNQRGFRPVLYGLKFIYNEVGDSTAGPYYDWSDCGHPADKRIYELTLEFDTNTWVFLANASSSGASVTAVPYTIILDTMGGVGGTTYTQSIKTFVLNNPSLIPAGGTPGRGLCVFPIPDGVIAKLVRLRAVSTASFSYQPATQFFRILNVQWQKEDYPADIVPFCEPEDGGYPYLKYCNQFDIDVDTNGVSINVQIQAEGATAQTVAIRTTSQDRDRTITLNPNLVGRKWRWLVDTAQAAIASGGGKFQVFSHAFKFQPADKGEVGHSFDFDDLGHPYDKYLITVVFEYENDAVGSSAVTLQMDTLTGITGQTITANVATFILTGTTGRCKQQFAFPADTIAKMIRIYPQTGSLPASYRQWKYTVQKTDYPPDIVRSTEWRDSQTIDDKNPSWLSIDMDTQGVPTVVQLQNNNWTALTVPHTGSTDNRMATYAIPVDQVGKMWRLLLAPGLNGKAQLFQWQFTRWTPFDQKGPVDPPDTVLWTPWNDFGYPAEKLARNMILDVDTGGIPASVALEGDGGVVLQTFSVTTTYTNRHFIRALNSNLISNLWRLVITPGNGGRFKLWNWTLDYIKLPAAVSHIDTYEQDLGTNRWKWSREAWIRYQSPAAVTMKIYVEGGVLFFTQTLPPMATRDVFRFFLPPNVGAVLNKTRTYRLTFDSDQDFYLFPDSYLDWQIWNGDLNSSTNHFLISPEASTPAG